MVFTRRISPEKRALVIFLGRGGFSFPKIAEKCKISTSSAERICKESVNEKRAKRLTCRKRGHPRKISSRVERMLKRNILKMRSRGIAITVKKLVEYSGLNFQTASERTYLRCLNNMGFWFLQARKKGLLNERNKKSSLQFARRMERYERSHPGYWANEVAFYLDGVSFVYKSNPMSAAMAPKARVWCRKSEGLQVTGKGSKDLAGDKRLHVIVSIDYGKRSYFERTLREVEWKVFCEFYS